MSSAPLKRAAPPRPSPVQKADRLVVDEATAWGRLGLTNDVSDALLSLDLVAPSEIQDSAIPAILGGEDIIFAAQTGSGKTLAYLAPLFSALKAEEALDSYQPHERRPRALVLVPTRELAAQVLSVAKALGHVAKLSCRSVTGGSETIGQQKKAVSGFVDIVIAAPGRFVKLWEKGEIHVSRINHVVIDEVDTMLTNGFGDDLKKVLKATCIRRNSTTAPAQVIMTTATLTKPVTKAFADADRTGEWGFVPKMRVIESTTLHRAVETSRHMTIDANGRDKIDILTREIMRPEKKRSRGLTLVFCNTVSSCRAISHALRESEEDDFEEEDLLSYHGEMSSQERAKSLATFRTRTSATLVCTDLAARGLDMPSVEHVVMFDFPRNSIDYLHRAGRTARYGEAGKVTALVTKRDKVLATGIEQAIARGEPLDNLTSNKEDYAPGGAVSRKQIASRPKSKRGAAQADLKRASRNTVFSANEHKQRPGKETEDTTSKKWSSNKPPKSPSKPRDGGGADRKLSNHDEDSTGRRSRRRKP